jgi:hypothetical protein
VEEEYSFINSNPKETKRKRKENIYSGGRKELYQLNYQTTDHQRVTLSHYKAFSSALKSPDERHVLCTDRTELKIYGVGEVTLPCNDVLYIPGLRHNLISETKAMQNGCEITKNGNRCIIAKDGMTILEARIDSSVSGMLTVNTAELSNLHIAAWHKRLGHVNCQYVKNLGITDSKEIPSSPCETCSMNKNKRAAVPAFRTYKRVKPNQLLHMDIRGKFSTVSLGKNHYISLIIDDYTSYTWTHLMTTKDQTLATVKKTINQAETYQGK